MSPENLQKIEDLVLKLDLGARARLAERLLQSLDQLSAEENEQLWLAEAKRRQEELASRDMTPRDAEAVLRGLEAELQ